MKDKLEINIRPIRKEDVEPLYEIRTMKGVKETITSISSERIAQRELWFNGLTNNDHIFIAEGTVKEKKRILGSASLHIKSNLRYRHSAGIAIAVHADFNGIGIGRKLTEHLIDLADNWLNIVRLELNVSQKNERAIKLYQSFGFQHEGILKYAMFTNGEFEDLIAMARYNLPKN